MESVPEASDKPKRIQLSRRKGWRKPEGAIVVARPSKWGNPYRITTEDAVPDLPFALRGVVNRGHLLGLYPTKASAAQHVVDLFRDNIAPTWNVAELAGHDLACWCPLDQPCHADVLLEIANS